MYRVLVVYNDRWLMWWTLVVFGYRIVLSDMKQWMNLFHDYLIYDNPLLVEKNAEKESILD